MAPELQHEIAVSVDGLCGYCVGVPATETGGMSCIRRGCCVILMRCHVLQAGLRTATPISLQAAHRLCKKVPLHSLAMHG